ncbi:ankyrin, partial [Bimuria novae-zelandiae CBS 107.79]
GLEMLEFLVKESHLDYDLCDNEGRSALHGVASQASLDVIRYLLELGADMHQRDTKSWTAIHYAASGDTADSLRILLPTKIPPKSSPNADGWSPLHLACRRNGPEALDLLIQAG